MKAFITLNGLQDTWDVVAFDWEEFSGLQTNPDNLPGFLMDAFEAARAGDQIGKSIFNWLQESGIDIGSLEELHLLGHSSGSWLIDGISDAIATSDIPLEDRPKIHLTFFDAFEAPSEMLGVTGVSAVLGGGADNAEQYLDDSFVNLWRTAEQLPFAANIEITDLDPDSSLDPVARHAWPYRWYLETIKEVSGVPFVACAEDASCSAAAWGFVRSPLYLDFIDLENQLNQSHGDLIILPEDTHRMLPVYFDSIILGDQLTIPSSTGDITLDPDGGVRLATGSPAILNSFITLNDPFNMLRFDFEFLSDAEGLFTVFFEGEEVFQLDELFFIDGRFNSGNIYLGDIFDAGTYSLIFRLDPFSDVQSIIDISNIQFGYAAPIQAPTGSPAPEPMSATLGVISLMSIGYSIRRRQAA